jgi:hypothetical protein
MEPESGSGAVFLSAGALRCWEQKHGRELSAAKMALFQAFDEHAGRVDVDMVEAANLHGADLDTIAEKLNIE